MRFLILTSLKQRKKNFSIFLKQNKKRELKKRKNIQGDIDVRKVSNLELCIQFFAFPHPYLSTLQYFPTF